MLLLSQSLSTWLMCTLASSTCWGVDISPWMPGLEIWKKGWFLSFGFIFGWKILKSIMCVLTTCYTACKWTEKNCFLYWRVNWIQVWSDVSMLFACRVWCGMFFVPLAKNIRYQPLLIKSVCRLQASMWLYRVNLTNVYVRGWTYGQWVENLLN